MDSGMTCTPVPTEYADGSVTYHFDIESDATREAINTEFNSNDMLFEDEEGQVHHRLEHLNLENAQYEEEDYVEEMSSDDFYMDTALTDEDAQYIRDVAGGDDAYFEMMEWMSDNIPEQMINSYNRLLSEGNVVELEEVLNKMTTYYNEKTQGVTAPEVNKRQPKQQPQEDLVSFEELAASPQYQQMIEIASQVLSTQEIEKYDAIMNSGDHTLMSRAVTWLGNRINE